MGYTHEKRAISSLALGLYDAGDPIYVRRVGTGFTEEFLDFLHNALEPIRIAETPVVNLPEHDILLVRPELVCAVEYLELTAHGHLRAPSFRGLRDDKPPEDCIMDQVR